MNLIPNGKPVKPIEQNVNDVSRISQGTAIHGDLTSPTDIRVDGQVDGSLFSEGKVVVGESARLSGKLFGTTVDFWGKMDGDVFVSDTLSLKSSSTVNGNIHVRRIQVEMGAQINGSFKMITEQEYNQLVNTMVKRPVAAIPAAAPAKSFLRSTPKSVSAATPVSAAAHASAPVSAAAHASAPVSAAAHASAPVSAAAHASAE